MSKRFSIETLEIAGLHSALNALRLPYGKECRSDTEFSFNVQTFDEATHLYTESVSCVNQKDLSLLKRLILNGDEHAKAIRGFIVYAEISAPRWMWSEIDTYIIGTQRLSSESTMHIDAKGLSGEELMEFKDNIKESKIQKRIQYFSYQTLRRIYFQRRNHRLPVWREFCDWIETLPFADSFITIKKNGKNFD